MLLGYTDGNIEYVLLHTDLSNMRMLTARDVHTEASILNNGLNLGQWERASRDSRSER